MLRSFVKFTAAGRLLLIPHRFFLGALPYCLRQFWAMVKWAGTSREHYNHTYHLTTLNRSGLISYIAVISGHDSAEIERYVVELEADVELRTALEQRTRGSPERHNSDIEPRYGRRLGWYALVRATKPRVVVETGVDRGLGTVVLAAAVRRNWQEGLPGVVYATDIVPDCGHLLIEPFRSHCVILVGDSVASLRNFSLLNPDFTPGQVDIFLHDSDHTLAYEWAEFAAIKPRLHAGSIVLSDNSQQSSMLIEFAALIGRTFLYFQDAPRDHWWPGDGIGAAFAPGSRRLFQEAPISVGESPIRGSLPT